MSERPDRNTAMPANMPVRKRKLPWLKEKDPESEHDARSLPSRASPILEGGSPPRPTKKTKKTKKGMETPAAREKHHNTPLGKVKQDDVHRTADMNPRVQMLEERVKGMLKYEESLQAELEALHEERDEEKQMMSRVIGDVEQVTKGLQRLEKDVQYLWQKWATPSNEVLEFGERDGLGPGRRESRRGRRAFREHRR